jgi:anti-sigma B factor antagonist
MASSPPYRSLRLSLLPGRDDVVVVARGELDTACAADLERKVRELQRSGVEEIVIDLRGVSFMDSSGLRVLLSLRNDARRNAHRLALVPGPRSVQRIFELTATRGLFDWR